MRPALSIRQLLRMIPPWERMTDVGIGVLVPSPSPPPPRKAARPAVKTPEMKALAMRICVVFECCWGGRGGGVVGVGGWVGVMSSLVKGLFQRDRHCIPTHKHTRAGASKASYVYHEARKLARRPPGDFVLSLLVPLPGLNTPAS